MDSDGQGWAMDWSGITQIVRAYCRSQAILHNYKIATDVSGAVRFQTLEVDWKKVREQTEAQSQQTLLDWQSSRHLRLQFNYLVDYRAQTLSNERKFHDLQQDLSKKTLEAIDQKVKSLQNWQKGAEIVRDVCAGMLVVGSGIITGGTAWGVETGGAAASTGALATGAGLKGVAKYQEKHNVGSAVLETGTEIVTGLISLGPVTEGARQISQGAALAVKLLGVSIGGVMDVGKTLVEGESMKQAVAGAAAKMAVKVAFPSEMLAKSAIPIVARITPSLARGAHTAVDFAIEYAADSAADNAGTRACRAFEVEVHRQSHRTPSKHSSGSARPPAAFGADVPHLADVVLALTSGPGTDVDYVRTIALRSLQTSRRQPLMSIGGSSLP